jgi:hypothetical protein
MRHAGLATLVLLLTARCGIADDTASLIDFLRDAQGTNRGLYPRGEMTVKVVSIYPIRTSEFAARVIWSGARTYWDYERTDSIPPVDGQPRISSSFGRMFVTPEVRASYDWRDRVLVIHRNRPARYTWELQLRPDQQWFHLQQSPWEGVLDSEFLLQEKFETTVRREGNDRVILHWRDRAAGSEMEVVFSRAVDWNVVSYRQTPKTDGSGFVKSGSYKWERHPGGTLFLRHLDFRMKSDGRKPVDDWVYSLDVETFDPNPRIDPDQFSIAALNVAAGAQVREESGAGHRRLPRFDPAAPPQIP